MLSVIVSSVLQEWLIIIININNLLLKIIMNLTKKELAKKEANCLCLFENTRNLTTVEVKLHTEKHPVEKWDYRHRTNRDTGIRFPYESDELGFKFILYRPELQSDIPSVTLDVTLNGTEMAVLAILKQKPDSSRGEIADKISKTVRTVQRALDSLRDKGYILRVGSKQDSQWKILK